MQPPIDSIITWPFLRTSVFLMHVCTVCFYPFSIYLQSLYRYRLQLTPCILEIHNHNGMTTGWVQEVVSTSYLWKWEICNALSLLCCSKILESQSTYGSFHVKSTRKRTPVSDFSLTLYTHSMCGDIKPQRFLGGQVVWLRSNEVAKLQLFVNFSHTLRYKMNNISMWEQDITKLNIYSCSPLNRL